MDHAERYAWSMAFLRGAEGIRTPDLLSAIQALSQLSYSPVVASGYPSSETPGVGSPPADSAESTTLLCRIWRQVARGACVLGML
jgi:hypothetical protein